MTSMESMSELSVAERLRDRAIADLDELIGVIAGARQVLRSYESALQKNRRHLASGGRASELSSLLDIPSLRTSFTDGMSRIERARNVSRLSLWRMLVAEGTTISDIARAWGLSRQLVSRALIASED